ncbi:hypothetical protein BKA65DRAFT_499607 [Rhexocercosporidium sp. MPI-PUGE-AT-0058]|nr:hypothetical protein BKA65DRAFT_499607 [Rhexocercosporidium sp. MPI-PUGE-AT-0058]
MQKPLKLIFGPIKDRDDVGKRRKVPVEQRARYRSTHSHIDSPFPVRNTSLLDYRAGIQRRQRIHPSAPDVRISIGGRTVPPGVSSSTGQRRGHWTSERRSSRAVSSLLLLDDESPRAFNNNERLGNGSTGSEKTTLLLEDSSRVSSNHGSDGVSRLSQKSSALSGEQRSRQEDLHGHSNASQGQGRAGVTADSLARLQRDFQKHTSPGKKSSRHPHKQVAPEVDLRRRLRSGKEVFSSSSASVHHPQPHTSKKFFLLREGSLQLTESNLAQLGNAKPTVSSSQLLENDIWRKWVQHESEDEQEDDRLSDNLLGNEWISPGMSMTTPLTRLPNKYVLDDDAYSTGLEEPFHPGQLLMEQDDAFGKSSHKDASSQWEGTEQDGHEGDSMEVQNVTTRSRDNAILIENYEEGLMESSNARKSSQDFGPPAEALPPREPPVVTQTKEDPDDVWRKFVFGSSDGSDSPDPNAADNTNIFGRGPGQSSIIAHPSSEEGLDADFHSIPPTQPITPRMPQDTENTSFLTTSYQSHSVVRPSPQTISPARDGKISMHASNGSAPTSTSALASTSRAIHARPSSSSSHTGYNDTLRSQKKVVFTKPEPFIERNSNVDTPQDLEPLYIGRRITGKDEKGVSESKGNRARKASEFLHPEEQDELKSIEDD